MINGTTAVDPNMQVLRFKAPLQTDGPRVTCPDLQTDHINVVTRLPLVNGRHYFEFVIHHIGDAQLCGVTVDPNLAGSRVWGPEMKNAWLYYCGRVNGCPHCSGCGS